MTISSSLNAGVAGLSANASRLATISDNIANSATYGYRRAETDFHSVVAASGSSSYTAGGVRTTAVRLIDQSGALTDSSNATDIAVNGRGFLPMTSINAAETGPSTYPLVLGTTGSFRLDENGWLTTSTGEVLMGWPTDSEGNIGSVARDSLSGLEPVRLNTSEVSANPTTTMTLAINLPATETQAGATGGVIEVPVEYYGNLGASETLTFTMTPVVPATGSSNQWQMQITDSASGGAVVGEYLVTFSDAQATGGRIDSVTTVSGAAYDATTGEIAVATAGGTIRLSVGIPGMSGGMTQLSDSYEPTGITKNGTAVARAVSLEVDEMGRLHAVYDQGFTRVVYQIPLLDVPNANGLVAVGNQTYQLSPNAGSFYLWDAGDGPTGTIAGYAREESATDVAHELTQLIQTQRAYSSNAKVIQTVDEMLQETTNLKR